MKMRRLVSVLASMALPTMVCGQELNLSQTYAGQAIALQVTPWGGESVVLSDSGVAPAMGGKRENSLRDAAPFPGVTAHELYAVTQGASGRNNTLSSLAYLDATIGSHRVTALWVGAEAKVTSGFLSAPGVGKCTFVGLTVDGQLVPVTGEANQTITFPDGFLIINEQKGLNSEHLGSLTVNALHFQIDGAGSLIAASAKAEVINSPTPNTSPSP
jgi:hypothetical protein